MRSRHPSLPDRRTRALAALLCCIASGALLQRPSAAAEGRITPADYLRNYLDLREKHGVATAEIEGIVEVRGAIQGKVQSVQTTWMVRPDSEATAAYQLVSGWDVTEFEVGMRVCALGRGLALPGATLELLAIVSEGEMAQWEATHAPPQARAPARRSEPSRVIVLNPSGGVAARQPAAPAPKAAAPPAGKQPPRWRNPKGAAAAPPARTPKRQVTKALSSRGWDPYIQRYTHAVRFFNPRLPVQQAETISRSILAYSNHYGIDARLVVAVIAVESGFSTTATSHKGAMGLGQLMPGTAAGLGVRNAYDPVENIYGAVKLLRGHLKEFSGQPFWDQLALALASYNAGSGAVKRHGGIPPYRETQRYIVKVAQLYAQLCGLRASKR